MPQMRLATAGAFGIALPVPRARRAGPSPSATATPPPAYRRDSLGPRFGTLREPSLCLFGSQGGKGRDWAWARTGGVSEDTRHRPAAPPPPSFTLSGP
jgi:hypothetical protein